MALHYIFNIFRFALWQFKLRKKVPAWATFRNEFLYFVEQLLGGSRKIKFEFSNCVMFRRYGGREG
jgi:hypothetical protein